MKSTFSFFSKHFHYFTKPPTQRHQWFFSFWIQIWFHWFKVVCNQWFNF